MSKSSNSDVCLHPYITIHGHITIRELKMVLSATDQVNGLGNRILWVCCKHSKKLAEDGKVDELKLLDLAHKLEAVLTPAWSTGVAEFDDDARRTWVSVYENELDVQSENLFGEITAYGPAHVVRLALVYALLDPNTYLTQPFLIRPIHLQAALAIWKYRSDSARCIFGDSLGDHVADKILSLLKAAGAASMTDTEIYKAFGKNTKATELDRAKNMLLGLNKVAATQENTKGAPITHWTPPFYVNTLMRKEPGA